MLNALSESVWARVLNAHAYIDSELKFGIKEELEGPFARFQVLEVECLDRYEGWCQWATEEEALRIFSDGVIDLKVNEMERIVQLFRDVKRIEMPGRNSARDWWFVLDWSLNSTPYHSCLC
jgi:hypothetical protein